MSLTIFLRASDGIVMAADSRVTDGHTLSGPKTKDSSVKFIQLNKDAGIMTHGLYDIGVRGMDILKESVSGTGHSLSDIVKKGRELLSGVSEEWSARNRAVARRDKDVGFILCGFDRHDNSLSAYCLESPGFVPRPVKGNMLLSGQWHIARFLLTRLVNDDTDTELLKNLAAVSLKATAEADKTVGGPVRLGTITASAGFQWAAEEELRSIENLYESFSIFFQKLLRSSFAEVLAAENKT